MANSYKNDKGFLIIEMSHLEAANNCNFGLRVSRCKVDIKCDICNNNISASDNCYYIAIINQCVCKDCCDDFIKNYNREDCSESDNIYEKRHYNNVANMLNLKQVEL